MGYHNPSFVNRTIPSFIILSIRCTIARLKAVVLKGLLQNGTEFLLQRGCWILVPQDLRKGVNFAHFPKFQL